MKTFNIYFCFIILFVGTAGIWLPLVANAVSSQDMQWESIPINITSYFIVLLITSCTDKGLELIDGKMPKREFLVIVAILILSLFYVFGIGIAATHKSIWAWLLSILGLGFSLWYWYSNSKNNPKCDDASNTLGGSSEQFK
jgi:hypothetical protein